MPHPEEKLDQLERTVSRMADELRAVGRRVNYLDGDGEPERGAVGRLQSRSDVDHSAIDKFHIMVAEVNGSVKTIKVLFVVVAATGLINILVWLKIFGGTR